MALLPIGTETWFTVVSQVDHKAGEEKKKTYRASITAARVAIENSVLILAGPLDAITGDLDVVVQRGVGGRFVLEETEPNLATSGADTEIERSPVANGLAAISPLAALLGRNTLRVQVVLSRSGLALPLVVRILIGAGEFLNFARGNAQRNRLGFSA